MTPKSTRSGRSTAAERRLTEIAGDGGVVEGASLQLPNHRSAVFTEGATGAASPGGRRRGMRAQRTAMLFDSEASRGTRGASPSPTRRAPPRAQRTAMLYDSEATQGAQTVSYRPSRTAMLPCADDAMTPGGRRKARLEAAHAMSEPSMVTKATEGAKATVQNFTARMRRALGGQ